MRKEGEEVGFACDKKEIVRIPRLIRVLESNLRMYMRNERSIAILFAQAILRDSDR